MDGIPQAVIDGAGSMSTTTLLWIIAGLMTVITTLGGVITSLVNKRAATALQRTNPLNGTLVRLDSTLREVNTTLTKVDVRAEDSNRVLARHSEQLVAMGVATAQLAANEAQQTIAISQIMPQIDTTLTGCASRQEQTCKDRTGMILNALET